MFFLQFFAEGLCVTRTIIATHFIFDCVFRFSGRASKVKLKLGVRGFNFTQCAHNYQIVGFSGLTNEKQLCASGEGGDGTCSGDGGELVAF